MQTVMIKFSPSGLSKLMQGADSVTGATFLFRIHRVPQVKVSEEDMNAAGLNPHTNPYVYFLVKATLPEPGERFTGPLTLEGALAVARSRTETFNRQTNYGAF